jgi:2-phosphoglycerate kinase
MAKTLVIDSSDGTKVPFLRGILTRSLVDAGVDFDAAYKLASAVRHSLSDVDEITTEKLKVMTLGMLEESFDRKVIDDYQSSGHIPDPILVIDSDGQASAFSRVQHTNCLESCGLSSSDAKLASKHIYHYLLEREVAEISSSKLGHLTYVCLRANLGREVAKRYMVWVDFTHSGRPLILLIGGTTGCGKSTIATEVAHRLGVVRTQSTDMLREVMRMMIPKRLSPVLHTSSFDAWRSLPGKFADQTDVEERIADGYRAQMELLSVPCEAVIQRALKERVALILEGIHVHPALLNYIDSREDAIIIPIMLAVLKKDNLQKRLRGRGQLAPERDSKKHLSNFDRIWALQSFLLSEADRHRIPIIANDDKEKATAQVMKAIIDSMEEKFSSRPSEVFGHAR